MQNHFQLDDSIVYLNHAAVAPWPVATATAVKRFADENASVGAQHYPNWMVIEANLREKLRLLINAGSVDDIALLKSTSEGLSFIAHGLGWNSGDNIVIPAEEFPSNRIIWQSLRDKGVEIRLIPMTESSNPEQDLINAIDKHTRLLSCSSVQFARGLRLNLEQIGSVCQQKQVLFCVDAIQSLGAFPFDVEAVQADFVVADGHKWMLGPEGLALFYCRASVRDQLQLHEFGWHMVENPHDFDTYDWKPAATAIRFECGSPNTLGAIGLNASLGVLLEFGIRQVSVQILQNTEQLITTLKTMKNVRILTPQEKSRRSGIVTFSKDDVAADVMYKYLMQSGVICAPRGGGIRLSPHFYTSEEKLARALELIRNYAG